MAGDNYFDYLVDQVDGHDVIDICKHMHTLYFHWDDTIPLESVRVDKGVELRLHYFYDTGEHTSVDGEPCTVLELLVALSIDMANVMSLPGERHPDRWFHEMIDNLGLDDNSAENGQRIKKWMTRSYAKDGKGGLFPLKRTKTDQRRLALWSQANSYLIERM